MEIDYTQAVEEGLEVLYKLKQKEAAFYRLYDFTQEIRQQWKYGAEPNLEAGEDFIDYVYRRLHEVIGEAQDD